MEPNVHHLVHNSPLFVLIHYHNPDNGGAVDVGTVDFVKKKMKWLLAQEGIIENCQNDFC